MVPGILTRDAVDRAIVECDELGRDRFLEKHGFKRATKYSLVVEDREYDPKAIVGVAYGYDHPDHGALAPRDFSGGQVLRRAFSATDYQLVHARPAQEPELRQLLEQFLETYLTAKKEPFSGKSGAFLLINRLKETLASTGPVDDRKTLRVQASVGRGNWAEAPWIAFLDTRETTTTRQGIYPVLLFKEDMSGVYVTVAQGITKLKEEHGQDGMEMSLKDGAQRVISRGASQVLDRKFLIEKRPTIGSGLLAKGYELSVIAHKLYTRGSIPNDQNILDDIEAAIALVESDIEARQSNTSDTERPDLCSIVDEFRTAVSNSGLLFPPDTPDRPTAFLSALIAKPFAILTGMSGSGKTQLGMRLGEWLGHTSDGRSRFLNVAVRPDWTGPEAIFGYEDALRPPLEGRAAWHVPNTLEFLLRAANEPDMPYLLLLDEMNLAHVERYFADYLAGSESRSRVLPNLAKDGVEWRVPEGAEKLIPIPRNVIIVGTVNVDETTYQFSPKVLDRATTFEVRTTTIELDASSSRPAPIAPAPPSTLESLTLLMTDDYWHLNSANTLKIADNLKSLHGLLAASDQEFGHRTFHESLRLAAALESAGVTDLSVVLDQILLLKILPKIHGSRRRVEPVLKSLADFARTPEGITSGVAEADFVKPAALRRSLSKIERMLRNAEIHQFVSFAE